MSIDLTKGCFTIPGEEGCEDLTLRLAEKWGADCIRDSDGTQLPDSITKSGYDIYSTLCLVRADNEWAKKNMDKLQQSFLMSEPVIAEGDTVVIDLLKGYFREQFILNKTDDPKEWWQVFDRTTGEEVALSDWDYDLNKETVTIKNAKLPFSKNLGRNFNVQPHHKRLGRQRTSYDNRPSLSRNTSSHLRVLGKMVAGTP